MYVYACFSCHVGVAFIVIEHELRVRKGTVYARGESSAKGYKMSVFRSHLLLAPLVGFDEVITTFHPLYEFREYSDRHSGIADQDDEKTESCGRMKTSPESIVS